MRIFSLGSCLLLAACGGKAGSAGSLEDAAADATRKSAEDGRVACMVDGGTAFASVCTIRQSAGERGLILTISGPNGGFRRLLVTGDGRGVVVADGAEPAVVMPLNDGLIEVAVGPDRYRLPATVKPFAGKSQ